MYILIGLDKTNRMNPVLNFQTFLNSPFTRGIPADRDKERKQAVWLRGSPTVAVTNEQLTATEKFQSGSEAQKNDLIHQAVEEQLALDQDIRSLGNDHPRRLEHGLSIQRFRFAYNLRIKEITVLKELLDTAPKPNVSAEQFYKSASPQVKKKLAAKAVAHASEAKLPNTNETAYKMQHLFGVNYATFICRYGPYLR